MSHYKYALPLHRSAIRRAAVIATVLCLPVRAAAQTTTIEPIYILPASASPTNEEGGPSSSPAPASTESPPSNPPLVTAPSAAPAPGILLPTTHLRDVEAPVPAADRRRVRGLRLRHRFAPYPGGPIPEGAVLSSRANLPMILAGSATIGAGYLSAIVGFVASIQCTSGFIFPTCRSAPLWLFVPIVGPFVAATDSRNSSEGIALMVLDGIVQTTGLLILIGGAVARHPVLEFRYYGSRSEPSTISVVPSPTALSVVARF